MESIDGIVAVTNLTGGFVGAKTKVIGRI